MTRKEYVLVQGDGCGSCAIRKEYGCEGTRTKPPCAKIFYRISGCFHWELKETKDDN